MKTNSDLAMHNLDIWSACRIGDERVVRQTIHQHHSLIHEPDFLEGRPPLFLACRSGHRPVVQLLLEAGARDRDGSAFSASKNDQVRRLLRVYDSRATHYSGQEFTAHHISTVFHSQITAMEHLRRASSKLIDEHEESTVLVIPQPRKKENGKVRKDAAIASTRAMTETKGREDVIFAKKRTANNKERCKRQSERTARDEMHEKKADPMHRSIHRFWWNSKLSGETEVANKVDDSTPTRAKTETKVKCISQSSMEQREDEIDKTIQCRMLNRKHEITEENGHIKLYYNNCKAQIQQASTKGSIIILDEALSRKRPGNTTIEATVHCISQKKGNNALSKLYHIGKKVSARGGARLMESSVSADESPLIDTVMTFPQEPCTQKCLKQIVGNEARPGKRVTFSPELESINWSKATERIYEMFATDDLEIENEMSETDDDDILEELIFGMSLIMDDIVRDGPKVVREAIGACFPSEVTPSAFY